MLNDRIDQVEKFEKIQIRNSTFSRVCTCVEVVHDGCAVLEWGGVGLELGGYWDVGCAVLVGWVTSNINLRRWWFTDHSLQ